MTEIQNVTTQQLIIGGLVIITVIAVIMGYDTEIIMAVIGGLIGYLTNSKVDQDKIQETIQEGITETMEEASCGEVTHIVNSQETVDNDDERQESDISGA